MKCGVIVAIVLSVVVAGFANVAFADGLVRNGRMTSLPSSWAVKELGGRDFRARFPVDLVDTFGGWDALPDTLAYREAIIKYSRTMGVGDYAEYSRSLLRLKNPDEKFALPYAEEQKSAKPYTLDHYFYLDGHKRKLTAGEKAMRESFLTLLAKRPGNMFDVRFYDVRPVYFLISDDFGADTGSYPAWRKSHSQFAGFTYFLEADSDFNWYMCRCLEKNHHPVLDECMKRYSITGKKQRDIVNFIQVAARQGRKLYFNSDEISGLYSLNITFGHEYARAGIKTLIFEADMNATSGPWAWGGAFMRGAARQWDCRTAMYIAHCFDSQPASVRSWTRDGKPSRGECHWPNRNRKLGSVHSEPYLGSSRSLLRRGYFYAWASGCSILEVENPRYFFLEDAPGGKFRESFYSRDYSAAFDLDRRVDRGVPYVPVAILASADETINRFCSPYGRKDPLPVNAFLFTLLPTLREDPIYLSERKNGDLGCLWNSEFGEIWDVLTPDSGQASAAFSKALSPYRAAFLVGTFDTEKFDRASIDCYVRGGGTLFVSADNVRNGLVEVPAGRRQAVHGDDGKVIAEAVDCGKGRIVTVLADGYLTGEAARQRARANGAELLKFQPEICSGRVTFPVVKKLLSIVRDETVPFKIEGDVQWGVNRTEKGWFLWFVNNKGSVKFAKEPESIDRAFDGRIKVTDRRTGKVRTLVVPAADFAWLEIEG